MMKATKAFFHKYSLLVNLYLFALFLVLWRTYSE